MTPRDLPPCGRCGAPASHGMTPQEAIDICRTRRRGVRPELPFEIVSALIDYDPDSGVFTYRARSPEWFLTTKQSPEHAAVRWNLQNAGRQCFTNRCKKQAFGHILKVPYSAHRVAWLLGTGKWPSQVIDHINGDPFDNRLRNLRDVSIAVNNRNMKKSAANSSGTTGVSYQARDRRWVASYSKDNRMVVIGRFAEKEDAIRAREDHNRLAGYGPRHGI